METKLKIPFDFNPSGENTSMTVYAPETTDCESANIKRGLINIPEFYNSNAKTISRISGLSSSGNCSETVSTESESDVEVNLLRRTELYKCPRKWLHTNYEKTHMADFSSFCEHIPKNVRENVMTRITKSKDGSNNPKILIKSTQRFSLISVFAPGLFDDLTSQTVLELKEVRDVTPEVTPSGSSSMSSTEVIINMVTPKNKQLPEYNQEKVKESFKKLKESLNKLDADPHLENQEAVSVLLDLNSKLISLKKDSIKTLYKELDDEVKPAFFQILGLTGSEDGIVTVIFAVVGVWGVRQSHRNQRLLM